MSPLDFQDYKLGRYLLKKQALFAHKMCDGKLQYHFAEDDIHMAHQYSRLSEQTVRTNVGYYLEFTSERSSCASEQHCYRV